MDSADMADQKGLSIFVWTQQRWQPQYQELMGRIHYDPSVNKALGAQVPFMGHDSRSRASKDLVQIITNQILHDGELPRLHGKTSLLAKLRHRKEKTLKHEICSVLCLYWEQCDFKNEGKPCELGCL